MPKVKYGYFVHFCALSYKIALGQLTIEGQKLQVITENVLNNVGFDVVTLDEYFNLQAFCLKHIISNKEKNTPEKCHFKNKPLEVYWDYELDTRKTEHFSVNTLSSGYSYIDKYSITKLYGIYYLTIKKGRLNLVESLLIINASDSAEIRQIIEKTYNSLLLQGDIKSNILCDKEKCRID